MFEMSKTELLARLQVSTQLKASVIDDSIDRKLILLTPAGMILCKDATIRTQSEIAEAAGETGQLNLLEMALSVQLPEHTTEPEHVETFLYCTDAEITTYSGNHISIPSVCISLESIFGFSIGTQN